MAETRTTPQTAKEAFSINGLLKPDAVLGVAKATTKDIPNETFANLLKSVVEKPVNPSAETNTSLIKVATTESPAIKATASIVIVQKTDTPPTSMSRSTAIVESTPVVQKTAKELKEEQDREWNKEKGKRTQWNDANRLYPRNRGTRKRS